MADFAHFTHAFGMIILNDRERTSEPERGRPAVDGGLRKYAAAVQAGRAEYRIQHNLGTEDVIVQTRIAGRIREGGVSIVDANTVQLTFGGVLNEGMQVVIIG